VSDLAHLALDLSLWGDPTGEGLQFLDRPPAAHLSQAQEILRNLGAITADGKPTAHGRTMASLPIHPRLAHMVIKGKELNQGAAACELSALLEERDSLSGGAKNDIDLESRIDALQRGVSLTTGVRDRIASQKRRLIEILQVPDKPSKAPAYGLLLSLAYPDRIARKRPDRHGSYQLANGAVANLPQGSLLAREEFIAVADIEAGGGDGRIYLASPVSRRQLEEAFAAEIVSKREIVWDSVEESVRARSSRKLGAVILEDLPLKPEGEEITQVLIEGIGGSGSQCLPWNKEAERFRERIQWARGAIVDVSTLPDCSDEALIGSLDDWLAPFLGGMWKLQQLQRLNLLDILQARLSVQQRRALDRLAPSHLQVPSGSRIAIDYSQPDHPALSVKLQELFGLTETPRVGGGTIPVTIHLLSPAARPLAVTQDLKSFWQNTYPEIRKQLRARYPKHPWPENPLTATPTRRTVRRG
jgi:ATP-dependent helicase HrpB